MRYLLLLVLISPLAAQENVSPQQEALDNWMNSILKDKDTPDWVNDYILGMDPLVTDPVAHTYFRRFFADPNTRSNNIQKFVEYLSLAGYPSAQIVAANPTISIKAEDIYKAVYFALSYTIMDGLPSSPPPSELPNVE